jgi:SpoVK/Ycf46/Vps4 family AAA+-type ATPase
MVFNGNPGTGKTTVARIMGKIYGAMGILEKGHLVETDRSGLVAEYAGQTGPKTNKKVDEALDGVLFIDEAYSLTDSEGQDTFGREAVQALLKRMEDDRKRIVVILAGYPVPMDKLLKSNPGLSSRFNTKLTFEDYTPSELGRIFQLMCNKNLYEVPGETQVKLLLGFKHLFDRRDEHFGNGRMVRNTFERAIRQLANRIAGIAPLTKELLTQLKSEDIKFKDVPDKAWDSDEARKFKFRITCGHCDNARNLPGSHLGQNVKCKKCDEQFVAVWGEPVDGGPDLSNQGGKS